MTKIALLVTGKTERLALAESLGRIFEADFCYVDSGDSSEDKLDGFTSARIKPLGSAAPHPESNLAWFVSRLVATTYPGRHGKPPDLVIGIDDLELENVDQPGVVVEALRDAVRAHVEQHFSGAQERVYVQLRERCSFHLLKPMVEAYFFGESAALDRSGKAPSRLSRFDPGAVDPEDFLVSDPDYEAIPAPPREATRRKSVRRKQKQDWRNSPERRPRHPKKYVQFLCDALGEGNTAYQESVGGAAALRTLAWDQVLSRPGQVAFARALLADLASAVAPRARYAALFTEDPKCATWPPPMNNILRNL